MDKFQKIGVSAFIHNNSRVLILRRSKKEKFMSGFYDLPGGKVEFGESLEKALEREIKEETNLKIKKLTPYSSFSYISDNGKRHTVDIQFLVEVSSIKAIKMTDAHDDYKWIRKNEISNYKMSKERKRSITNGFAELKNNN